MKGIFGFNSPADLLKKLEGDFAGLKHNPRDASAAINFFVTAESLLDWLHPGHGGKSQREKERCTEVLLQITSHLATGAKHFSADAKHHQSVKDARKIGGLNSFAARTFTAKTFTSIFPKENLVIDLDGEASKHFGDSITAYALAERILEYWKNRISGSAAS